MQTPSSDSMTMVLIVGLRTTSTVPVRFISKRVVSVRCKNLGWGSRGNS